MLHVLSLRRSPTPLLLLATLILSFLTTLTAADALTWFYLTFNPAFGAQYTHLSGQLTAPLMPGGKSYFFWAGLQPPDYSGVLQTVLRSYTQPDRWSFMPDWSDKLWTTKGTEFNVTEGNVLSFSFDKVDAGNINTFGEYLRSSSNWTVTNWIQSSSLWARDMFWLGPPVPFDQAILAVELLDGQIWDFGPLIFNNVTMIAEGSLNGDWCAQRPYNFADALNYTISNTRIMVIEDPPTVTCILEEVRFDGPWPPPT